LPESVTHLGRLKVLRRDYFLPRLPGTLIDSAGIRQCRVSLGRKTGNFTWFPVFQAVEGFPFAIQTDTLNLTVWARQ
jgi:hypothetical protein